jgi:predicted Zn-dependent protease
MKRSRCLLPACLLLAACASAPEPPAAPLPARDWLGEIRAATASAGSAVEVLPLADPAVADLRTGAAAAMNRGDFAAAAKRLERALEIRGDDPVLWQELAEALVGAMRWQDAERAAQRSYNLGPKLGELCARNGYVVFAVRIELGDAVGAAAARAQIVRCSVAPPVRL